MNKVLTVDDDKNILAAINYYLGKEGYTVVMAEDGTTALELARNGKPDLIILDVTLPGLSGLEVCRILRKEMSVPILLLTARVAEIDKIVGLELGADDYVTKPFSMRELLSRIRALLRRSQYTENQTLGKDVAIRPVIKAGGIEVDIGRHRVIHNGVLLELSPKEFDLLSFLMNHRGQVFDRSDLVEKLWGNDYSGTERTVDVHIRSLRKKIEANPDKPEHLLTVHGFGYKFAG